MTIATDQRPTPVLQPYRWTIERYHQAIAAGLLEGEPVELLDGEIVVMPAEGVVHAGLGNLGVDYLRSLLGNRVQIREGKPITLPTSASEPEPDVAIVEPRFWDYVEHHPYVENIYWLIEYANTSLQKDLEVKDKIYAQAGIEEYWVMNLQAMELVVFREPVNGEYRSQITYRSGGICPLAFPEIEVSIDVLLGGDRWVPNA